ncbi:hypothetical protein BGZ96_008372 [Linnemannia gamsii]|uniref:Uncharacterized protein n=1 Tax=Linnemannia gamsii TaxID=64522 RepID=A0ABQ7JYH1_9FUNG|nr:hypothetical protein BGZ96_008372 [Linnemannia gamsii]
MLCGCPALKCLTLKTMTAEEGSHIRVLTRADFFIPDTDVFDDIDSSEPTAPPARQPKCVIAYSLHILKMTGQWVLDDSLVPVFFYDTFPKLRTMTLKGVSGFTLPALVDCLRTKAMRISELVTTIPGPTTEEGRELGLVRRIGRRMELEYWDYGVTLRGGEEYKLLKDPRKGWE